MDKAPHHAHPSRKCANSRRIRAIKGAAQLRLRLRQSDCSVSDMKVAIIGAGITGLAAGYAALKAGRQPLILEASGRIGGVIESQKRDGFLVDFGPNSLRVATPEITQLLEALDIEALDARPGQDVRRIVRNGRLKALPRSQAGLLTTPAWSLKGKLRLLKEPWVAPMQSEDESLADFIERRLGTELLDYAADPFVSGIYAANPKHLSVRWAFPKLYAMERQHGSLIRGFLKNRKQAVRPRTVSFADGMEALPQALARAIGPEHIRLQARLLRLDPEKRELQWEDATGQHRERFDAIAVTVPAQALPQLPWPAAVQKKLSFLSNIPYAPLSVLALGFQQQHLKHPCDGFGFLVPARENKSFLGTIFSSFLFPGRAPKDMHLLTSFMGGMRQPELASLAPEAQVARLCSELKPLLGLCGPPVFVAHRYWPRAVAQYDLDHGKRLEALTAFEAAYPGWSLFGHFRGGVALPACIQQGLSWGRARASIIQQRTKA